MIFFYSKSRNSAVVMSVIQLYLYLAPNSELNSSIVRPLIRLLHSKPEIQIVILTNIVSLTSNQKNDQLNDDIDDGEDDCKHDADETFLMDNDATKSNQLSLKSLFEPLLKSFFVKSKDPTQVRILKLKILTNLSSSYNIPLILREFQAYINNYQDDMRFVSATIEAIGKCASRIKEIASICLNGLISLLSNRNEMIIAQSIIVIRKQIINKQRQIDRKSMLTNGVETSSLTITNDQQQQIDSNQETNDDSTKEQKENPKSPSQSNKRKKDEKDEKSDHIISLVIKQVAKLIVDKIKTPTAKATVLWILAEFCDKNMKAYQLSPDILRLVAKSFINEVEIVKLQAINLAAKVYLTTCHFETCKNYFTSDDKDRIKLLINYIFNLAKYDLNYDVRDRARFLRQLLNKSNTKTGLILAQKILMAPKNIYIENNRSKDEQNQSNEQQINDETNVNENQQINDADQSQTKTYLPSLVNGMSKYRIGTLSHFIGKPVNNYEELDDFPLERPDPSVRNTRLEEEDIKRTLDKDFDLNSSPIKRQLNRSDSNENFYSNDEDESSDNSETDEDETTDSESSDSETESSSSDSDESNDSSNDEEQSEKSDSNDEKTDKSNESNDSEINTSRESLSTTDVHIQTTTITDSQSKDKLIKC